MVVVVLQVAVDIQRIVLVGEVAVTLVGRHVAVHGRVEVVRPGLLVIAQRHPALLPVLHAAGAVAARGDGRGLVGGGVDAVMPAGVVLRLGVGAEGVAVERHRLLQVQALGDHVQALPDGEVRLQAAALVGIPAQLVDGTVRVVREHGRTAEVLLHRVVEDVVDVGRILPEVAEQAGNLVVRPVQHLDAAAHVEADLEDLQDVEVQVRADVEPVVSQVLRLVGVPSAQDAFTAQVIQIDIVAGVLGSAVQDEVGVPEHPEALERRVVPVDIHALAALVVVQLLLAVGRRPDHAVVVGHGLVVQGGEFVGAERLVQESGRLEAGPHAGGHGRTAFPAAPGRDPDDAVGAPLAVEREGGGVLEDLHLLDFGRGDGGHVLLVHLETVHEDLGGGPGAYAVGSHAADQPLGGVVAQLTAPLHHGHAGESPGEGVRQVGVPGLVEPVAGSGGNGARAVLLGREGHGREEGAKERGISCNLTFHSNRPLNQ